MKNEIIIYFSLFILSSYRVRFGLFIFFLTFSEKQAAISESICIFALIKKQMVLEKNITIKQAVWEKLGEVYPVAQLGDMRLPFFDVDIVAGFPIPLDNDEKGQDIELLRMLCPNPEASYLIRVQGNSMIDAGIYDGDIIIVDKSNRNPAPTEVAVCELNGEYTLKRFERRGEEGWLVPANPSYPEIRVTEEDSFSIWGTVTYIIHKPRG
jgi:DNA polymerase V